MDSTSKEQENDGNEVETTEDILKQTGDANPQNGEEEFERWIAKTTYNGNQDYRNYQPKPSILEVEQKLHVSEELEIISSTMEDLKNEEHSDESISLDQKETFKFLNNGEQADLYKTLVLFKRWETSRESKLSQVVKSVFDQGVGTFSNLICDDEVPIFVLTDKESKFEMPNIEFPPISDHPDKKKFHSIIDAIFEQLIESTNFNEYPFGFSDDMSPITNSTQFFVSFLDFFDEHKDNENRLFFVQMFLKTMAYHIHSNIKEAIGIKDTIEIDETQFRDVVQDLFCTESSGMELFSIAFHGEEEDKLFCFMVTDENVCVNLENDEEDPEDFDMHIYYNEVANQDMIDTSIHSIKLNKIDGHDLKLIICRYETIAKTQVDFLKIADLEQKARTNEEESLLEYRDVHDFDLSAHFSFYRIFTRQSVKYEHPCYKCLRYIRAPFILGYKKTYAIYNWFFPSKDKQE